LILILFLGELRNLKKIVQENPIRLRDCKSSSQKRIQVENFSIAYISGFDRSVK